MDNIQKLINESLDERGKLPCATAYKIASKLKMPVEEIGKIAKKLDIRISDCGLGQFGKLKKGVFSKEAYEKLKQFTNEENKITCKNARECAKGFGLKTIRGTIESKNIDVTYCQLGCFTEKRGVRLYIKTKTWMENGKRELLFGKGKTEILEEIKRVGSISKAAKNLGMNYKKAWMHIKLLQKNLEDELVIVQKGAGEDSGTRLTPKADEYIRKYKQLQREIEEFANERFKELFLKPRGERRPKVGNFRQEQRSGDIKRDLRSG